MDSYNQRYRVDEHLLAAAVHFTEDSIIITTRDMAAPGPFIVYVNPGFTRMTGYSPEEVIGKSPRLLQGPKTDSNVLKNLRATLERGEVFHGRTINYRKDGSEFWNEWHIEPIRDERGEVTHYLAIQHDVTRRVQDQMAIEQKNAALREILEQIEIEKKKIREDVLLNVENVLLPAFKRLRRKGTKMDRQYLDALEKNLKDLTSAFGSTISAKKCRLSPREIEIANLIRSGLTSKEICEILKISFKTIETHRHKIRKKLGIVNQDINLTTLLQNT